MMLFIILVIGMANAASTSDNVPKPNNVAVISDDMMGQVGASIMGESALVDKETGRVLWEGGTTTLSASLGPILPSSMKHARATVLTGIIILAIIGSIVARIRHALFAGDTSVGDAKSWPVNCLLFLADWTVLRFPQVNGKLLTAAIVLYILEAYTCSTRRYLANAISTPVELEAYVERLRQEPPVVTWKVRCFHYERRRWISILSYLSVIVKFLTLKREEERIDLEPSSVEPSPWIFTRKVVTNQAVSHFNYTSCEDKTIAGVWRRAEATSTAPAPFSKIVLSKLLILPNAKARQDYFSQQSSFVTSQGSDDYTEFSTSIQVKGFQRRMLAVRPVEGIPSTKLFRLHLFWLFTLFGLTVPYRIWFARHCDELRVTVAKETSTGKSGSSSWSWFSKSTQSQAEEWNKEFKSKMRELSLYAGREQPHVPMIEVKNSEPVQQTVSSIVEEEKGSEIVKSIVVEEEASTETKAAAAEKSEEDKEDDQNEKHEPLSPTPPVIEDEQQPVSGKDTDNEDPNEHTNDWK
jgi:hypothetical protein